MTTQSLVSAEWLAANCDRPDLLVLDASKHLPGAERDAAAEFTAAHIPGARFLDLAGLIDAASPIPNTLPTPAHFASRMSQLGMMREHHIILYDDSNLRSSARAWFLFRIMGMMQVAILDGGLQAWRDGGFDLASGASPETASATMTGFTAAPYDRAKLRDKAQIIANCKTRAEQVVDARDAARFNGDAEDTVHGLSGGHIPGARNVFFRDLLNDDGTFKTPSELRAAFEQTGVTLSEPIVTSCGSGMTASVLLFALHLIGVDDAALYDGSWSEWGADPDTPKTRTPKESGAAA